VQFTPAPVPEPGGAGGGLPHPAGGRSLQCVGWPPVQCSAVQCIVQCAVQCPGLCGEVPDRDLLTSHRHHEVPGGGRLRAGTLHCIALHVIALHVIALHCTALHYLQSVPAMSEAGIKDTIGPYCRKAEFLEKGEELSVKALIDTGICPPWWVGSFSSISSYSSTIQHVIHYPAAHPLSSMSSTIQLLIHPPAFHPLPRYLKSSPIFGLCLPITFEDNSTRLVRYRGINAPNCHE
jgi:hypothetical protein